MCSKTGKDSFPGARRPNLTNIRNQALAVYKAAHFRRLFLLSYWLSVVVQANRDPVQLPSCARTGLTFASCTQGDKNDFCQKKKKKE